jgi:cytochrome c oxidase cbb3-type subunit I/II
MVYNIVKTIGRAQKPVDLVSRPSPLFTSDIKKQIEESLPEGPHRVLEGFPVILTVLTLCGILVGTLFELVPMLTTTDRALQEYSNMKVKPLSALAVAGRDIYVKEGCYTCHSQMIRTMVSDVLRYGPASEPAESMYDHPFQWGSRRVGPDLARVGGRYPDLWHLRHMLNPRDIVPQSLMPGYPWMLKDKYDIRSLPKRLKALQTVGVPYTDAEVASSVEDAKAEAERIATELKVGGGPEGMQDKEITALIAYLQSLGKQGTPK